MQPVRIQIGMNSAVILLALLLAVPLQLFFSHYISKSYEEEEAQSVSREQEGDGVVGVQAAGAEALDMLEEAMGTLMEHVSYYSTPANLKELFVVPFKRKGRASMKLKQHSEKGSTPITVESNSNSKTKQTKTSPSSADETMVHAGANSQQTKPRARETRAEQQVEEQPTSVAKEVKEYLFAEVYFAQSKEPRSVKPTGVAFSVGQVIRHKQDGYFGVIIGWDTAAKAPQEWLERHFSVDRRQRVITTPHYLVLVDSHFDASANPFHYLPQEDMEVITSLQVRCPEISKYFEGYSNGRHIPRPWLKTLYPRDDN